MAVTGTTAGGGAQARTGGATGGGYNSLHPHVPAGSPQGGQFAVKGGGGSGGGSAAKKPAAKKPKTAKTAKQPSFATLQKLEKKAQGGGKLTATQKAELHTAHLAHVAHVQHVAAVNAQAKAAKMPPAKPVAARATTAAKPARTPSASFQKRGGATL